MLVCAKSRRALVRLSALFKERRVHKVYRAVVVGKVDLSVLASRDSPPHPQAQQVQQAQQAQQAQQVQLAQLAQLGQLAQQAPQVAQRPQQRVWTATETELLRKGVAEHTDTSTGRISWANIVPGLPGRGIEQAKQRWKTLRKRVRESAKQGGGSRR